MSDQVDQHLRSRSGSPATESSASGTVSSTRCPPARKAAAHLLDTSRAKRTEVDPFSPRASCPESSLFAKRMSSRSGQALGLVGDHVEEALLVGLVDSTSRKQGLAEP